MLLYAGDLQVGIDFHVRFQNVALRSQPLERGPQGSDFLLDAAFHFLSYCCHESPFNKMLLVPDTLDILLPTAPATPETLHRCARPDRGRAGGCCPGFPTVDTR